MNRFKESLKYITSIILLVIFINFWTRFQNYPNVVNISIIILIPTLTSLFFVFRILNHSIVLWRVLFAISIVSIVTLFDFFYRNEIIEKLKIISTDIETGLFLFLMLYVLKMLMLTFLANAISQFVCVCVKSPDK